MEVAAVLGAVRRKDHGESLCHSDPLRGFLPGQGVTLSPRRIARGPRKRKLSMTNQD